MHIDAWLNNPFSNSKEEEYAKFVLEFKRMPSWKQDSYAPYMEQYSLFCTYKSGRYRCTGTDTFGYVELQPDFTKSTGFKLKVDVEKCSNWSKFARSPK